MPSVSKSRPHTACMDEMATESTESTEQHFFGALRYITQSAQRRRERRESFVFSRQSGRAVTTPVVPEPRMARYPGPRQRSRRFTPYRLPSRGPGSALRFGRDDGCYCFPVIPAKRFLLVRHSGRAKRDPESRKHADRCRVADVFPGFRIGAAHRPE